MGIPRQEYWSGLAVLSPGSLLDLGIECGSFPSPAWAGGFFSPSAPWEALESTTECLQRERMAHHILTAFQNSAVI